MQMSFRGADWATTNLSGRLIRSKKLEALAQETFPMFGRLDLDVDMFSTEPTPTTSLATQILRRSPH